MVHGARSSKNAVGGAAFQSRPTHHQKRHVAVLVGHAAERGHGCVVTLIGVHTLKEPAGARDWRLRRVELPHDDLLVPPRRDDMVHPLVRKEHQR